MYKINVLLISIILLAACGPRLEQVTDYIPPVSQSGLACIQNAQVARQNCQQGNVQRVSECNDNARQASYKVLKEREQQYTVELETYIDLQNDYEAARKSYNENQRLILRDGELAYVRCSSDVNMTQVANFPQCKRHLDDAQKRAERQLSPVAPVRPVRPTQDVIYRELASNCSQQRVNCNTGFDQAYISCGGRIERNTVCVSNCN